MFDQNLRIKDVKQEIGQLVRSLRKQEAISQNELAERLDLSRITIQNLEAGKNFTIDTLLKVLQHFDLLHQLNDLFTALSNQSDNPTSLY
ncbi:helix-turn-helix transcriptional regulator [Parvicella tangerina]|uniref:HTH cro/C1-type domain-containing protein n=1 Tax=Parvicella tangerina TaxID=2829795 RepID=A0A916NHC1_9FLAO|nr:helix-turn-helix transcriptional regulator [Parvicella tangerina]CAG5082625.1 hypothetical protein CRYO30217_01967 [Parvicella tangerina]